MSDAPLPPPPLLSPLQAGAAAAAAALSSLWGWLNSRNKQPGTAQEGQDYSFSPAATVVVAGQKFQEFATSKFCVSDGAAASFAASTIAFSKSKSSVVSMRLSGIGQGQINYVCENAPGTSATSAVVQWTQSNGVVSTDGLQTWDSGSANTTGARRYTEGGIKTGIRNISVTHGGAPFAFPPVVDPFYVPPLFPYEPEPLPDQGSPAPAPGRAPLAPPAPLPLPDAEPLPPTGDPGTGTGTGTGTGAATGGAGQLLPLRPPSAIPLPPGNAAAPDITTGTPRPPVVVVAPPVTDPGTEVTPDGQIGQPGTQPPPTLVGIAAEVGKIEQKTRQLLNRPAPELDLGGITDLIQLLLTLLQQVYGAGSYELAPVCEEGEPAVVSWGAGVGAFGQVNVKIDALADLLQAHKDMRQPICRQKASGEEVTVIFEEI